MAFQTLSIVKNWFTGNTCVESNWDNLRTPLVAWAETTVNDLNQVRIDTHGATYSVDNDGLPNLASPLRQWDTGLTSLPWNFAGLVAFSGLVGIADSAADHFYVLGRADLASDRTISLPLLTGDDTFVFQAHAQTLTNKTLTSPVVNTGDINDSDIDGGTIDGAAINGSTIGGTTPAAGAFTSISGTGLTINSVDIEKALVPIGTIVPIYDFSGALTFDSDYYAYCNGQSKSIGGVSRTLPDLSNRYIVGFGTEGEADIGSAAWATTVVGNASHQVNIAHTHTGPSHTHSSGSLKFLVGYISSYQAYLYNSSGSAVKVTGTSSRGTSSEIWPWATSSNNTFYTATGLGSTGSGGTGDTGSSLSTTQTIQPRSIRCRYIMRIK